MMGGRSRSPPTWTRAASVASESLVWETSIPTTLETQTRSSMLRARAHPTARANRILRLGVVATHPREQQAIGR